MNSLRFIALKLAAISKRDREWLLRRLSDNERARLAPELQRLSGLPKAELLKALEETPMPAPGDMPLSGSLIAELEDAPTEKVAALLNALPLAVSGLLLERSPGVWSAAFEASLTADDRRNLATSRSVFRGRASRRLEDLVMERIASALRETTAEDRAPISPFQKVLAG